MADSGAGSTPRANPSLFGHRAAEAALARAFAGGSLHHAWLFTGPRGVGKATLAYRFARHVLAGEPSRDGSLRMAPDRPVFRRVAAAGHADLATVERTADPRRKTDRVRSRIVVDDARALRDFFSLKAGEGGWRVAVIDAADEMNDNAANAVLKIVEEPPPRALLLLVAHVPGLVPATLRSRCRRLALSPLAPEDVARVVAAARPDLPEGDRALLAALSDGAPGTALALADEDGLDVYRETVALMATAPGIDTQALHAFADKLARRGAESSFRAAMHLFARQVARLAVSAARGEAPAGQLPGEAEAARRLLAAPGPDRWAALWERIGELAAGAERVNLDRKQAVLSLFLSLDAAARA